MKKNKTLYWILTGLFSAFMVLTAIPEIINNPDAAAFMHHLGYPQYLNPFIGIAKVLGIMTVLLPVARQLKEWAYAGLFFDLIGATYSQIATDGMMPGILFMLLPIILLFVSYYLKNNSAQTAASPFAAKEYVTAHKY